MKTPSDLKIVPVHLIPKGQECPLNDFLELYKTGLLMQSLCDKEKGIGLSAVQTGIEWKLYIINYSYISKEDYRFFINCNYEKIGDEKFESMEGCLSLKTADGLNRYFLVKRPKKVRIIGKELLFENGKLAIKDISFECEGIEAIVHMHETDHGNGILISDIGVEHKIWK